MTLTLYQLIKLEELKLRKLIGNEIALQVLEDDKEIYFEDCCTAEGDYDFYDLINSKVKNYYYVENYGDLQGKIKLVVEVL
ncbi:MAG: hypothetical protein QXI77_00970 [Nanopusillaceae archaeon]